MPRNYALNSLRETDNTINTRRRRRREAAMAARMERDRVMAELTPPDRCGPDRAIPDGEGDGDGTVGADRRSRVWPVVGPSSAHGAGDEAVGMTAIVLPWAVLVGDNARHGVIKGRILLTSRYREALSAASMLATGQWRPREPIMGAVHLAVTFYEPDKRRRDIGNYTKLIADALTAVAYDDDSQIDRLTLVRGALDRVNPRAEITVESR